MKLRQDFVTNSSSSSYIIAKHKDISNDEIKQIVEACSGTIRMFLNEYNEYQSKKKSLKVAKDEIISELINLGKPDMDIDQWNLFCGEANGEDGELFDLFIYNTTAIETEHFKKA